MFSTLSYCSSCTRKHSSQTYTRSEEHTSELQSLQHLVCRLLLEKTSRQHLDVGLGAGCQRREAQEWDQRRAGHERTGPAEALDHRFFFLKDGRPPELHPFPPQDALRV